MIVTHNTRDFPRQALAPHGIQTKRPDSFVVGLLDTAPALVHAAARAHRRALQNPPHDPGEYLDSLRRNDFTRTADRLAAECPEL